MMRGGSASAESRYAPADTLRSRNDRKQLKGLPYGLCSTIPSTHFDSLGTSSGLLSTYGLIVNYMSDQDVRTKAREMLAHRLEVIDNLTGATQRENQLRQQLSEAQAATAGAWTKAAESGWSARELRQLGFTQPPTRRGGRPKGARTSKPGDPASGSTTGGEPQA